MAPILLVRGWGVWGQDYARLGKWSGHAAAGLGPLHL